MKKIIAGIAMMAVAVTTILPATAATFKDVDDTYSWAKPYIEDMSEKGLISGYEDNTFKPGKTVSKIETISLFARAMGSRNEINKDTVAFALSEYEDEIKELNLNFGQEDVAYMLYRKALTADEAKAYLKGEEKNKPMLRYEAATIITKAMGAEEEAKRNLVMDMEYTDVSKIPASAKKYVYYVTQKGLMSGMGDSTFSPNTSVLRAQIAVMLSNAVEKMNLNINKVKIDDVDTEAMKITYTDEGGEEYEVSYTEDTGFFVEGAKVTVGQLQENTNAVAILVEDKLMYVDVIVNNPDEEVAAIYSSYEIINSKVMINAKDPKTNVMNAYTVADDITDVIRGGESATIRSFKDGDYLIMTISNGVVVAVEAIEKSSVISGAKIEKIDSLAGIPTITISHKDEMYNGMELVIGNNVQVIKDGNITDMNDVYRGDNVNITLEYGQIIKIVAQANKKNVEGTIREIRISATPSLTVLVNDKEVVYDISKDVVIYINGEPATFYDFRVGDRVTLTTESEAVVKVTSTATVTTSGNVTGVVTSINGSYKFIRVQITNESSTYEETVYCKDNKTTFITAAGVSKAFKDLKEGSVVSAYGTITNGAFEATSVIIVNE